MTLQLRHIFLTEAITFIVFSNPRYFARKTMRARDRS
jgi:hypothetical protein